MPELQELNREHKQLDPGVQASILPAPAKITRLGAGQNRLC